MALELAQKEFIERGERRFPPLTKYDLYLKE